MPDFERIPELPVSSPGFETEWFTIRAASQSTPQAAAAMERLCRTYWYPLYAYIRRRGFDPPDAQDLTQEFFAQLLAKPFLRDVDQAKGRFRSFLLASLNHFLANNSRQERTLKRGGSTAIFSLDAISAEDRYRLEPAHSESPGRIYDRNWAMTLLERARARLREECFASGKGESFDALKARLDDETSHYTYSEIAARLATTEAAVQKTVQRLRERYQELLRAEIAQTVSDPREVEEELRSLFAALSH